MNECQISYGGSGRVRQHDDGPQEGSTRGKHRMKASNRAIGSRHAIGTIFISQTESSMMVCDRVTRERPASSVASTATDRKLAFTTVPLYTYALIVGRLRATKQPALQHAPNSRKTSYPSIAIPSSCNTSCSRTHMRLGSQQLRVIRVDPVVRIVAFVVRTGRSERSRHVVACTS
jgi:hypothetical protein